MKILHTADWHLGKKSDDLDRMDEQKDVINQIVKIAKENAVDMVIIAGDVYDSLIPSSEAENLFYKAVSDLSNNGNTAVVVIAGNHDDPKRLSNASVFAGRFNVYLVGDINDITINKNIGRDKNIVPTACGKGYIKFRTKAGEECVVACLPYPSFYRYHEVKHEGDNINDKIKDWMNDAVKQFSKDTINIVTAHVLTHGTDLDELSASEYASTDKLIPYVDKSVFDVPADYIALGHLHTMIKLDKKSNMFYSGATINTLFSENNDTEKYVIIADVEKGKKVKVEPFLLDAKKLDVFESDSIEEIDKFCHAVKDEYVKAILKNASAVDYETIKTLRKNNPNLITISVVNKELLDDNKIESRKDLSNAELFDKFVNDVTGEKPNNETKELFLELMGEILYETN